MMNRTNEMGEERKKRSDGSINRLFYAFALNHFW